MFYEIKKIIFPSIKNISVFFFLIALSLVANAGVYKHGTLDAFNGIADNGNEIIAVGDVGMIYTRSLSATEAWVGPHDTGITSRLLDVAAAASYEDVAVGELGVILTRRLNSTTWSAETSGTLLTLRKALVDPNNGNNIIVGDEGVILFYDKTLSTWTTQASGTTENLTAIVVNEASTLYTVLSKNGTVITSTNGKDWEIQSGVNYSTADAIYYTTSAGKGRYLSVGATSVSESDDGINWNMIKSLTTDERPYSFLNDISYSAETNMLTIIGNDGVNLTSTDDGLNWTGNSGRASTNGATNYQGSIYSATYGQTIIGNKSGIDTVANSLMNDMYFNASTGLYVAVGDNAKIITSTDGVSWANSNFTSASNEDVISIAYGGGKYAAITDSGNFLTSNNGIDWTTHDFKSPSIGAAFLDIAVDSTGSLFVVISDRTVWSWDGSTWESKPNPFLNAVIYSDADNQFVAVGQNKIQTSPDGIAWTSRSVGAAQGELRRFYGVMYNAGLYVAVGETNNSHFTMTSTDGETWTAGIIKDESRLAKLVLYDVVYDADANEGSGQYVAAGWGGVMVSPDAVTWTEVGDARNSSTRYKSVVYDSANKQYVAIGEQIISLFSSQMVLPTFTAATETIIESLGYSYFTPEYTSLKTQDYRGRTILPKLVNVDPSSAPYALGAYTLTWEAIDGSGNRAQFDQSVVLEDTIAPVLTLNGDASVIVEAGTRYFDQGVNIDEVVGYSAYVKGGTFVNTSFVGDFTITYNVTDIAGNAAAEVVRNITVVDTVVPTIVMPRYTGPITVNTTGEFTAVTTLAQPIVTDATAYTLTNDAPANGFVVGETLVTWTVTDAAGNTATVTQKVTVLPDTVKPRISLNGLSTITLIHGRIYNDAGASVYDKVDSNIKLVTVNPVDSSVVGTYTITYNATDFSGNKADEVIRTVNIIDILAPVLTLTGSSSMRIEVGSVFTDPGATVTDDVDSNLNITVTGFVNPDVAGNYTLTYSATDSSGNIVSRLRLIEVYTPADTESPVIIAPAPVIIVSPDGNGIAREDSRIQAFLSGATATDNVGIISLGAYISPGVFPIGTTNVTFGAFDQAGNESTIVSSVTVTPPLDTTAPVISIGQSVSLSSTDGNGIAVNDSRVQTYLESVQVYDDSGVFTISYSTLPDILPVGESSVIITATDAEGNQQEVTVKIIVVDNSNPADKSTVENNTSASSDSGSGGGGSMGWFMLLMAGFFFLTRRLKFNS